MQTISLPIEATTWDVLGPSPELGTPTGLARAACRVLLAAMYSRAGLRPGLPGDCAACIEIPVQAGWLTAREAARLYYAGGELADRVAGMCSDTSLAAAQERALEAAFSHEAPLADAVADLLLMAEGRVPTQVRLANPRLARAGRHLACGAISFHQFLLSRKLGGVAPALALLIGPIICEHASLAVNKSNGLLTVGELVPDAAVDGVAVVHFVRSSGFSGQLGWSNFTPPSAFEPVEGGCSDGAYLPAGSVRDSAFVCTEEIRIAAASVAYWPAQVAPDLRSRVQRQWRAAYGPSGEALADAVHATMKKRVTLHEVGHVKSDARQRRCLERLAPEKWWTFHAVTAEMCAEAYAMEKQAVVQDERTWWATAAAMSPHLRPDLRPADGDPYGNSRVLCLAALFQNDPSTWLQEMIERICAALVEREKESFRAWMSEMVKGTTEECLHRLEPRLGA